MRIRAELVVSLLLAGIVAGCSYTETHRVVTGVPGPPRSGDVEIVLESAPAPPGLTEVAIVQTVGHGENARLEDLVAGLKTEARRLGCDVVVRVRIDQGTATASASGIAARRSGAASEVAAHAPATAPMPTPAQSP
jgi:hypothetical protein